MISSIPQPIRIGCGIFLSKILTEFSEIVEPIGVLT